METPAEKNARVAQERKDKWLDAQIASIMKEGTGKDSDGNTIPVSYQDAYDQAMEQMKIRFGEFARPVIPTFDENKYPNATRAAQAVSQNDWRNNPLFK